MKTIINELIPNLTLKQKVIILYFIISFCSLSVYSETPTWILIFLALNLANATRLVKKVPLPEIE